MCLNQFFGKVLFVRHPSLSLSQLIVVRSLFAMLIFAAIMNKDVKRYLFESVPRIHYKSMALRCLQGSFQFMCIYTCIKYFPVVFVSIVNNISPLLIAFLSFILYKVALSYLDLSVLLISFAGVVILITGTLGGASSV